MRLRVRLGFSLLELIVAVAILGLVIGLAGATMPFAQQKRQIDPVAMASNEAARTARVVSREVVSGPLRLRIAAYPDGNIVVDTEFVQASAP